MLHSVEQTHFPAFLASPCFDLYANMLYFAFTRPPLSKHKFVWLKVNERGGWGGGWLGKQGGARCRGVAASMPQWCAAR